MLSGRLGSLTPKGISSFFFSVLLLFGHTEYLADEHAFYITNQEVLLKQLKNLFPTEGIQYLLSARSFPLLISSPSPSYSKHKTNMTITETHVNSRKKSNIKYPTGSYLELDIWIPEHQLAFEFQVLCSLCFAISYRSPIIFY